MTEPDPSDTVEITIHIDEEYQQLIEEEQDPDRWIQTSIRVDEVDIVGDKRTGPKGSACGVVIQLLESVRSMIDEEQYIVEFEYGPSWLAVDPLDEESITISRSVTWEGATDPNKRLEIDTSESVLKSAWAEEVIESAQSFYDKTLQLYPEFRREDVMVQIRDEIRDTRKAINARDI